MPALAFRPIAALQLPRTVPTLTAYADGMVNLNAEATALLAALGEGIGFHPPKPHRERAGNPRRPNFWELSPGPHRLLAPAERGGFRLRAGKAAPPPGRYILTPMAGQPDRFTLVPIGV